MNFPLQILFNDINHGYRATVLKKNSLWLLPFYMAVASYCYSEKQVERGALQVYRISLSTFILFKLWSWVILRVKTKALLKNFHRERVIMEVAMLKIFNNCIVDSLTIFL